MTQTHQITLNGSVDVEIEVEDDQDPVEALREENYLPFTIELAEGVEVRVDANDVVHTEPV